MLLCVRKKEADWAGGERVGGGVGGGGGNMQRDVYITHTQLPAQRQKGKVVAHVITNTVITTVIAFRHLPAAQGGGAVSRWSYPLLLRRGGRRLPTVHLRRLSRQPEQLRHTAGLSAQVYPETEGQGGGRRGVAHTHAHIHKHTHTRTRVNVITFCNCCYLSTGV